MQIDWVIKVDDLSGPEIGNLLKDHVESMRDCHESSHALDLDQLRQPEIRFWTIWDGDNLAGCGAIRVFDNKCAEIKSMRTAEAYRRRGVAATMVNHIIQEAIKLGITQLWLETGSVDYFIPARALYERFGFTYCGPYGDYVEDSNSSFMTKVFDSANSTI